MLDDGKATHILSNHILNKFKFIKQHRDYYQVEKICQILGVSRSGYYYWNDEKQSSMALQNLLLIEQIKIIHERNKRRYGSPRIARDFNTTVFIVLFKTRKDSKIK